MHRPLKQKKETWKEGIKGKNFFILMTRMERRKKLEVKE